MKVYCLVFKKHTDNTSTKHVKIKGKLMIKSICPIGGNK